MEKIAEKSFHLGTFIFYKGFDKDIILKHVENHDNKMMVVMATAEEFLENLPDKSIHSNYLAMYEVYSNHNEWVNKYWEQISKEPFPCGPEWSATRGILNTEEDIDNTLKKAIHKFSEDNKEEMQKMVDMINYEDGNYDGWVVYPMKNLKHYDEIMSATEESWNIIETIIQDLRVIGKSEDEILREIHWQAFNHGCKFIK